MTKSEIFKKAWELARIASVKFSEKKSYRFGTWIVQNKGEKASPSEFFSECLKQVWASAKSVIAITVAELNHNLETIRAPASVAHVAVANMMYDGDRNPAYDAIEM